MRSHREDRAVNVSADVVPVFDRGRLPVSSLSTVEGNRLGSGVHSRKKEYSYGGVHGAG